MLEKEMAQLSQGGESMDINRREIEEITAEKLRHLPLCEEDVYSIEWLDFAEEEDDVSVVDSGFMRGFVLAGQR